MSESGSKSTATAEKEEEEKLYRWIYDLHTYDLEEKFPYSPEHSPAHPKLDTDRKTYADERKGINVSENTTRMKQNELYLEKRPWLRPGANISDYFNYGFDEQTWNAYCKKQTKLQPFRRKQAKIKAQKMPAGYEEEPCCSYSSSGRPSIPASRESKAGIDVSRRRDGCSSAAEGHPCLSDETNNTQVVIEMSHEEDSTTAYDLMSRPVINKSVFAFFPPPSSLFQSECSPPSSSSVLGSEHNQRFDGPSTSRYRCRSASSPLVIDATKAWECYLSHGKGHKDRNRSRVGDRDKDRKRCRDRGKPSSSSSHGSDEKQKRQRKSTEHGHKHPSSAAAGRMTRKTGTQDTNTSKRNKKEKKRDRKRN